MMKYVMLLALALALYVLPAQAAPYLRWSFECSDSSTSFVTLAKDDSTGKGYLVFVDCDGHVNVWPMMCKANAAINDILAPWNLRELCRKAVEIGTPSIWNGVFLLDIASGDVIRFRNPIDKRERGEYEAMWNADARVSKNHSPPRQGRFEMPMR